MPIRHSASFLQTFHTGQTAAQRTAAAGTATPTDRMDPDPAAVAFAKGQRYAPVTGPAANTSYSAEISGWTVKFGSGLLTEKQASYLVSLAQTRDSAPEVVEGLKIRLEQGLAKFAASQVIDGFKKLPAKPVELNDRFQPPVATTNSAKEAPVKVEDGRYAVEEDGTLKFFRVTNGRKPGYVFLNVQASDEWYPVRNVTRIREVLAIIAKDPKAAMVRYGHELGECGKCGRTLTDEASRAAGIGPICAAK
jgi:hypothetical protein